MPHVTKVDELELEELGLERPNEAVNELEEDAVAKGFEANGFEGNGAATLANILPPYDAEKAVDELGEDAKAKGFEAKLANMFPDDAEAAKNELDEADATANAFELHTNELLEIKTLN